MPVILGPLFSYLGAVIYRVFQWLLANYLLGTLKSIAIYVTLIAAVSFTIYALVTWVNSTVLEIISGMPPVAYANVMGILAMMPRNLPYLVTAILTYTTMSLGAHIAVELAKFKARMAEGSMSSFNKK